MATRAATMAAALTFRYAYPWFYYQYAGYDHGWFVPPGGLWNSGDVAWMFWGFSLIAVLLVAFYNGRQGPRFKWAFYGFYPAHLAVLGILGHLFAG